MPQGRPDSFFNQPPYTILVLDSTGTTMSEYVTNKDGTWMGPLEDMDSVTWEEVVADIVEILKPR